MPWDDATVCQMAKAMLDFAVDELDRQGSVAAFSETPRERRRLGSRCAADDSPQVGHDPRSYDVTAVSWVATRNAKTFLQLCPRIMYTPCSLRCLVLTALAPY